MLTFSMGKKFFFRPLKVRDLALTAAGGRRKEKELILLDIYLSCSRYYVLSLSNLICKPTGKVDTIIYIFRCHTWSSERLGKLPKMTQPVNGRAEFFYFNVFYSIFGTGLGTHFSLVLCNALCYLSRSAETKGTPKR